MDPVCRVCMGSSVTLVDIFAKRKQLDKEPSLAAMLNECVDCKVKQDDPLPKQICLTCVLDAQNAFKFKRRCEQSYKQFWEMLNEDKAINELFAADDWKMPECPMNVDSTAKNNEKDKGHKQNKLRDLLQPAEEELPITIKQEKPDSDAEESSKINFVDNQLQPTEAGIDISCVKTEKLDETEEEGAEKIRPDNCLRLRKNLIETPIPQIGINQKIVKGKPSTASKQSMGQFISINTTQAKRHAVKHNQLYKLKGSLFKCPQCPKTSVSRADIDLHMHVHSAHYKCGHCPKSFYRRSELQTHLNVHSGQRPFLCPHCSQAFTHPSNLNRHIRTHVDKPPYKCSLCPKAFLNKEDAVQHILGHNASRTYKCPHCNSGLRQHNCRPVQERGKFTYINSKDLH